MGRNRFELRAPSNQTITDIFEGAWATNLNAHCGVSNTGANLLLDDVRISMAASSLGKDGRFDGCKILELGPLEGAHSYQLEQLGADPVIAVEANTDAFLKCLIVKEMLQLKTRFLCGDVLACLQGANGSFDMVFCCGILYHMADPLELIKQICMHSRRCFVWTHHFDPASPLREGARVARIAEKDGFTATYHERSYPRIDEKLFLGGNQMQAAWMTQEDIIRAFAHFGLSTAMVIADQRESPNSSHFSGAFAAERAIPAATS
jgi:SAM-dependent methyltransferase